MTDPTPDLLKVGFEAEVAIVTLNNPRRLNAFSWEMRSLIYSRLLELVNDDRCRAIVITGAGGNLCSGGDISEMAHREIIEARVRVDLATRIFKLLVNGPKPVLCAVEGNAAGAGVSFIAASDYAVAAADAKFSCAFVKVGLMPDVGAIWSLPRKVGNRKAMELAAFGESFGAEEALKMQLINAICEPGQALAETLKAASKFTRNPPVTMALIKAALNTGNDSVERAIASETDFQSVLMNTQDHAEAIAAFREKRTPNFKGR